MGLKFRTWMCIAAAEVRVSEALCMRFNPQSRRRVRNNDCCVPEETWSVFITAFGCEYISRAKVPPRQQGPSGFTTNVARRGGRS